MQVFIGTIMSFGFNFAPNSWALCAGQLQSISQNNAMFALLGTTFGGDGVQTFQLPNLQGRYPMSQGTGGGLTTRVMGEVSGSESVSIQISNMPSHTHTATFTPSGSGGGYKVSTNTAGNVTVPTATNNVLAGSPSGPTSGAIWATSNPPPTISLGGGGGGSGGTVTNALTGNSIPLDILNPYLAVNFSIALFGIFPSRN
ncbi:MAG TPA: tail fiber protein [Burkholderiaceae bacterium]|jgi:microcystin-dependent protein